MFKPGDIVVTKAQLDETYGIKKFTVVDVLTSANSECLILNLSFLDSMGVPRSVFADALGFCLAPKKEEKES